MAWVRLRIRFAKSFETAIQSFEPTPDGFRGSTETDSKVLRMIEKLPRNYTGFESLMQPADEAGSMAASKTRKNHRTSAAWGAHQFTVSRQEIIQKTSIGI